MLCNCKKCHHVWEQMGFTNKEGIPIDSQYTCPRCGTINGNDTLKERMREMAKKTGQKEPIFYD